MEYFLASTQVYANPLNLFKEKLKSNDKVHPQISGTINHVNDFY